MKNMAFSLIATSMFSIICTSSVFAYEVDTYDFFMPDVWPHKDELYLCTPIRIVPGTDFYVVGFDPKASMHTAHHMLLYGCSEPGANGSVWSCGEMQTDEVDNIYPTANPLPFWIAALGNKKQSEPRRIGARTYNVRVQFTSGSGAVDSPDLDAPFHGRFHVIVYAWARDAPSLRLPEDVGFLVGWNSPIEYLVLQVHYMKRFPYGKTDNSGVLLKYTRERMPRQAGVILLGTGGFIPPNHVEHMETACAILEDKVIHPFAFRTHTHALGKVVSGYVVRRSNRGDVWTLLGKKDPQLPQMFYPVANTTPIHKGDVLAARCTMHNTNDYPVKIGATNSDEMCNFYLMYWVENDAPLKRKYCFTNGPPYYYWANAPEGFNLIPDRDASVL